ncbi:CinA family protein [Niastella caeni]|uniref:CinA family protein n=1 Tax=Niastella caeni TaxID=2569763 RepID=A0A4S8HJE2_9BACT|nr:CinA family protein [Niastella caeni]THU32962.1 CinA family protein [Niastella caeni]
MPADIIQSIGEMLINRQQSIAVAESVTSGYMQMALSTAVDAAKFYQGGITAYNLGQKSRHLHIEPIHAMACNCVSEQVAHEMALQVCNLFNSHWGLAITGYASRVPESNNELFAYYAIANAGIIMKSGRIEPPDGESDQVQLYYTKELLKNLEVVLEHA